MDGESALACIYVIFIWYLIIGRNIYIKC
jgi:hypothetical protein